MKQSFGFQIKFYINTLCIGTEGKICLMQSNENKRRVMFRVWKTDTIRNQDWTRMLIKGFGEELGLRFGAVLISLLFEGWESLTLFHP